MSDATRQAIAALEDYLRRYPSGHFAELAQVRLDALLAQQGERRIVADAQPNPFSKGTVAADRRFRRGDTYVQSVTDGYNGVHLRNERFVVTDVTDLTVVFNGGRRITDLLGNGIVERGGAKRIADQQLFPTEYTVGKKWVTRYHTDADDGNPHTVSVDFAIVARESVEVPAGKFEAFRLEGRGRREDGATREFTFWMAPDRVRLPLAIEQRNGKAAAKSHKGRGSGQERWERAQLLSFAEAIPPGTAGV